MLQEMFVNILRRATVALIICTFFWSITSELFSFIVCFSYHNSWALVQTTVQFYLFKTCFALDVKGCQGS